MPKVIGEGRVLRGQFDQWQKRGLIDTEVAKARYVQMFRTIEREDCQDAAIRFSVCLVLADAFFETMIPFWKMTVVMRRYKLEQNFDQWFKKRAGVYKRIGMNTMTIKRAKTESSELFAFIKQPELIRLHNYLWYYRGHSEIKRVGDNLLWRNYLEFCEFVEALEKELLKFKEVMKKIVFLWEDYIGDKFVSFARDRIVSGSFARGNFFNRGGPKENKEFTLALFNSVSKEKQKGMMSEVRKWLNRYKSIK
ncbi:hypothetical protein ES702_01314 [subsurface metagenome]